MSEEQTAIKTLANIRRRLVKYLEDINPLDHSTPTEALVEKVISWAECCEAYSTDNDKMRDLWLKALDDLEEKKRPMSAQMEMQNRRIIGLNEDLRKSRSVTLDEAIDLLTKINIDDDKTRALCITALKDLKLGKKPLA